MTTIKYRADIDGLRAVAVLAVIAFHACPAYLPGGFIGVDMFFVIPGYLISGIIYKAQREDTFSYADFYARRVRRIFPALLAAVALCLAYGWLVLLPTEYEHLGGHVSVSADFFLTPFRAWEFLAGAILAWLHDRRSRSIRQSRSAHKYGGNTGLATRVKPTGASECGE